VRNFGDISKDNKHIITMEWIIEGVVLIFIGAITIGVTIVDFSSDVSAFVYYALSIVLLILVIISLFTGFKVNYLPFKLCPLLFTVSAILILLGGMT
jgi:hypothetical protein